jgi:hypothetical protein
MPEVYKDQYEPIKTILFWNGENVDADGSVVVTFYDVTEDPSITPAISPTTPITVLTATKNETNIGSYQVSLPTNLVNRERKYRLVWAYTISGTSASNVSFVDVVLPYASLADAVEQLGVGIDSGDPSYKTYIQLKQAEKYARHIIEDYTGQEFHLYDDTEIVYGSDSDILPLPYRIESIFKLYANDVLLYDATVTPAINNWLYTPIIAESNFAIRIDRTTLLDNTVYTANGMVPPTINDTYAGHAFAKNVRYTVVGKFGWSEVPEDVQQACINLMGHYFEKDRLWKDQYVKKVQTFDWNIEYSGDVFSGTGCSYADKLLSAYVLSQMVVI